MAGAPKWLSKGELSGLSVLPCLRRAVRANRGGRRCECSSKTRILASKAGGLTNPFNQVTGLDGNAETLSCRCFAGLLRLFVEKKIPRSTRSEGWNDTVVPRNTLPRTK